MSKMPIEPTMQGLDKCLMQLGQANKVSSCTVLLDSSLLIVMLSRNSWDVCNF